MNASIGTSSKTEAISISMQRADDDIFILFALGYRTEGAEEGEEGEGKKRRRGRGGLPVTVYRFSHVLK